MSIKIQKNIPLLKYTTFKIGGPAKYFCVVKSSDEIKKALEFAEKNKLKIFVLGGGSNLLISDKGFDGLVLRIANCELRIANKNIQYLISNIQYSKIVCDAGVPLVKLVNESIKGNLTGLEWAAGIPGTVGGAIVNNAGANGKSMSDVVEEVEILDIGYWILGTPPSPPLSGGEYKDNFPLSGGEYKDNFPLSEGEYKDNFPLSGEEHKDSSPLSGREYKDSPLSEEEKKNSLLSERESISSPDKGGWGVKKLVNKQCQFSYRDSVFKREKKYVILSAVLKLKKGNQEESKKTISEILKSRKEKQPLEYPSAGSVFKNPSVDDERLKKLIKKYPELNNIAKNNIIPVGWLIGQIDGLKNKKIGGAMISEKHCNFIVNTGNAKAEDVVILISLIKQKVRNRFGIQLKEEVEYVGF